MRETFVNLHAIEQTHWPALNSDFYTGLTALHYAAIRGSASMLLALLGAGAERHARDRAFRTPLDWARRRLALDASVPPGAWAADLADGLAAPVLQFDPAVGDARQARVASSAELDRISRRELGPRRDGSG